MVLKRMTLWLFLWTLFYMLNHMFFQRAFVEIDSITMITFQSRPLLFVFMNLTMSLEVVFTGEMFQTSGTFEWFELLMNQHMSFQIG